MAAPAEKTDGLQCGIALHGIARHIARRIALRISRHEDIVDRRRYSLRVDNGALILGIESSCDETAAAMVRGGDELVSSVVASQIATHSPYGGVVPELASREHLRDWCP